MKTKLFVVLSIVAILFIECKKEEFEVVTHEVYSLIETSKSGCFEMTENDPPIANIGSTSMTFERDGDLCIIECGTEYYCYASDSINLVGNTLELFLVNDSPNASCKCTYQWKIKLKIIEDKGVKLKIYGKEDQEFILKLEGYRLNI